MNTFTRLLTVCAALGLAGCQTTRMHEPSIEGEFDIGGTRLFLQCFDGRAEPDATPTVILEHGIGLQATSEIWTRVQEKVSAFARVCRYDRADVGQSGASENELRTGTQLVGELRRLLAVAGVTGPYVHVGHSFGGFIARLHARDPESGVVGIVLVDAPHEDMLAEIPLQPEHLDAAALEYELRSAANLADLPLVVVTRGKGVTNRWLEYQQQLLNLSSQSSQIIASESDHQVPWHQPDVVVEGIRRVLKPAD